MPHIISCVRPRNTREKEGESLYIIAEFGHLALLEQLLIS
jgi:hypothetical protein